MAPFKKRGSNSGGTSDRAASNSSASASASGAASPPLPTDDFSARRSARVSVHQYAADGDTWVEALAVCEIPVRPGYGDAKTAAASKKPGGGGGLFRRKSKPKTINDNDGDAAAHGAAGRGEEELAAASQRLTLRPYFQSQNTGQRVWDEPPSGASNIVYATPEARKMASAQLEEMRSTYAHAAVQRRQEREEKKALKALEKKGDNDGGKGSGKLVPKLFRRSSNSNNSGDSSSLLAHNHSGGRIKGSLVLEDEGGRKGIPKSILEESKQLAGHKSGGKSAARRAYEADLEKAMLMSMGIGGGSVMGVGENRRHRSSSASRQNSNGSAANATSGLTREEEEQLAMAKALSLSEQEAFGRNGSEGSDGSRKENFDASFDGGGKMPPQQQSKNGGDPNADFGDRGSSWELSWSRSG